MAGIRARYSSTHTTIISVAIRALPAIALSLLMLAGFAAAPARATSSRITEWPIPTAASQACGITAGPHGELWFAEGAGKLGSISMAGKFSEVDVTDGGNPTNISAAAGNLVFFTQPDAGKLGTYSAGEVISLFEADAPASPWDVVAGPGGVWFTERGAGVSKIARKDYTGRDVVEYTVPTADCAPWDITEGPDGQMWFTENAGNKIGRVTTDGSGNFTEYKIPTSASEPTGIAVGSDGAIWFTESAANHIGRLDVASGRISEFDVPTGSSHPYEITPGPDGNLWFTERDTDRVGLCTTTGSMAEFELPAGSKPMGIASGPDAALWFVEQGTNMIGRIPASFSRWYLAEGSTAWGFSTRITIENPNPARVNARVTYLTDTGPVFGGTLALPASSQTTINPKDTLGERDFSTRITCDDPTRTITVDRTMTWTGPGAASDEGHSSVGVTSPADTWYFPEGSSAWGFECWLLIQNPNDSEVGCQITYMVEDGSPVSVTKTVPANSRKSFFMADDIGSKNASIKVVSERPVIPERSMYRNNRREGHDSIGATSPASDCYLAEGTTASGFTTYLLVQNPDPYQTEVLITYMTPSGPKEQPPFMLPGNSRKTIKVNDVLPNTDFSTIVRGYLYEYRQPILAERAMYWDNGTGEACHDSIGMPKLRSTFYLPDGQTSGERETWTLVQNPNDTAVKVEIIYMTPNGAGDVEVTDTVPARSRRSYNMAEKIPGGRAAIMVTSKTKGKKIACERAMYWNNRGAGTDTIGGYSD